MVKDQTRRSFIRTVPLVAAVAALPLTDKLLSATDFAPAVAGQTTPLVPAQLFTADQLADAMKKLQAAPGNDNLFQPTSLPLTVVLTTEVKKTAKEFEWHEGRDHIVQIVDGSTFYEIGGTPQNGRNTKPGEWLAPTSQNSTAYTLKKGDMLIIPRGTPHKRTTADSVTLILISSSGVVAAT